MSNWTSAELSATEIANFAAGLPLLGANVMPYKTVSASEWSQNTTMAGAIDKTNTGYPISRLYDGKSNIKSRGYYASMTGATWYLFFDFGSGNEIEFDFFAILNHNMYSHGGVGSTWSLAISNDDVTYTPIINGVSITSDDRIVDWDIYHTGSVALRYTGVRYIRFSMTHSSVQTYSEQIGELIFGSRCQMSTHPSQPYSMDNLHKESSDTTTISGIRNVLNHYKYQQKLNASWKINNSTILTNLQNWYKYVSGGNNSFIYLPFGATYTYQWYMMTLDDVDFNVPEISGAYLARDFSISASEQGPESAFYYTENTT